MKPVHPVQDLFLPSDTAGIASNPVRGCMEAVVLRTPGSRSKLLSQHFIFLVEVAPEFNMDQVRFIESQLCIPHIGQLSGSHQGPGDQEYGQGELEDHQDLPEQATSSFLIRLSRMACIGFRLKDRGPDNSLPARWLIPVQPVIQGYIVRKECRWCKIFSRDLVELIQQQQHQQKCQHYRDQRLNK